MLRSEREPRRINQSIILGLALISLLAETIFEVPEHLEITGQKNKLPTSMRIGDGDTMEVELDGVPWKVSDVLTDEDDPHALVTWGPPYKGFSLKLRNTTTELLNGIRITHKTTP